MRKCKSCNGKGFVFDKIDIPSEKTIMGFPIWKETGIKTTCSKCFGKGMK